MEPKHSKALGKALEKAVRQVADIDGDEVFDFIQECVAEIAAHHVMGNIEHSRVKDLDYWEAQVDNFEAGLKVATALQEGDKILTASLDEGDPGLYTNYLFFFVGKDMKSVRKLLQEEIVKWIDSLRKNKGLLPFPTE